MVDGEPEGSARPVFPAGASETDLTFRPQSPNISIPTLLLISGLHPVSPTIILLVFSKRQARVTKPLQHLFNLPPLHLLLQRYASSREPLGCLHTNCIAQCRPKIRI